MRFRNPPASTPLNELVPTVHNRSIAEIQAAAKLEGIEWQRAGFWRAMQKAIFNAVNLEECDAGLEPGADPTTMMVVGDWIKDDFSSLRRVVPDLWRIDLSTGKVHALEVEDTCRIDNTKLCAYSELDHALESWGFDLRVWTTNRYGEGLAKLDLDQRVSQNPYYD